MDVDKRMAMDDECDSSLPLEVLRAYKAWHEQSMELMYAGQRFIDEHPDSEDLGDWVANIGSVLTFGPNPRLFPPLAGDYATTDDA